jgi:hypothetical protein
MARWQADGTIASQYNVSGRSPSGLERSDLHDSRVRRGGLLGFRQVADIKFLREYFDELDLNGNGTGASTLMALRIRNI